MTKPDMNTETSMLARLGNLIYWFSIGVATLCALMIVVSAAFGKGDDRWFVIIVLTGIAIISWGIGRGARYVLAGR